MVQLADEKAVVVECGLQLAPPDLLLVDHRIEGLGDAADVDRHVGGDGGMGRRAARAGSRGGLDSAQPAYAVPIDRAQIDDAEQRQGQQRRQQQYRNCVRAARPGASSKLATI